jgi:choline monooxygenase
MHHRFDIDPDVATASTLDKAFYLDPAVWVLARERIFARCWHWLGALDDVAEPGSLAPRDVLPGLLDEPLLLACDGSGRLRCLSNVCTHRGNLLVPAACRAKDIRCGYHARRFGLDGRMLSMPGFEQAQNFPAASDHLPALPLHTLAGHGYTAIDPAAPFDAFFGGVLARLPASALQGLHADPARSRDYGFDAHWALYVENYLEGLHIPFVHAGVTRTLDLGQYDYELFGHANLQLAEARSGQPAFELPPGSPDHARRIAAYYVWVFPNLMLNFYPWGLSVNVVQPLAPGRTRGLFRSFVRDPSGLDSGAGGALDPVEMEDETVVQTVQRGIRSRLYTKGRYSPSHERGVHQFHRLIARFMAGETHMDALRDPRHRPAS